MSEQALAAITQENQSLKKQLEGAVNQANGFVAQLDAHKGMLSESITGSLNLRTQCIMMNKTIQELSGKVQELEAKLALKEKVDAANQKSK